MDKNTNEKTSGIPEDASEKKTEADKVLHKNEKAQTSLKESFDTENLSPEEEPKKVSDRLRKALYRVGAAFIVVVILLAATKLSAISIIRGAKESDAVQNEEIGSFVKRDVFAIIGYYGEPKAGKYALVPMNGEFVTVYFTNRYLKSADEIFTETKNYLDGSQLTIDKYVKVQGTVGKINDEQSEKMYEWFSENKDWMVENLVIEDADDASEYLSDVVLLVDTVNYMNQNVVFFLTGIIALCLIYIIVELILMGSGFYLDKRKNKKNKEKTLNVKEKTEDKNKDNLTESKTDKEIEDSGINYETNAENTISSEETDANDSEKPGDK